MTYLLAEAIGIGSLGAVDRWVVRLVEITFNPGLKGLREGVNKKKKKLFAEMSTNRGRGN